jgi:hypothetical protein
MTNEQVDRAVQHLCKQLHVAIRLKGTEGLPPSARDLGFDAAAVRNVLLSGLRLASVRSAQHHPSRSGERAPPWSYVR